GAASARLSGRFKSTRSKDMNRTILSAFTLAMVCSITGLVGCDSMDKNKSQKMQADNAKTAIAKIQPASAASTQPANKNVNGTVTFTQDGDGVKVVAHIMGLSPGKHG